MTTYSSPAVQSSLFNTSLILRQMAGKGPYELTKTTYFSHLTYFLTLNPRVVDLQSLFADPDPAVFFHVDPCASGSSSNIFVKELPFTEFSIVLQADCLKVNN